MLNFSCLPSSPVPKPDRRATFLDYVPFQVPSADKSCTTEPQVFAGLHYVTETSVKSWTWCSFLHNQHCHRHLHHAIDVTDAIAMQTSRSTPENNCGSALAWSPSITHSPYLQHVCSSFFISSTMGWTLIPYPLHDKCCRQQENCSACACACAWGVIGCNDNESLMRHHLTFPLERHCNTQMKLVAHSMNHYPCFMHYIHTGVITGGYDLYMRLKLQGESWDMDKYKSNMGANINSREMSRWRFERMERGFWSCPWLHTLSAGTPPFPGTL
jgi:hypothetical protein